MNYYLKEIKPLNSRSNKTGGAKIRQDVEKILSKQNFTAIAIPNIPRLGNIDYISVSLLNHYRVMRLWQKRIAFLKEGDNLVIQFPLIIQHSIFLKRVLKSLTRKKIKIILIIHDLESLRVTKRQDISIIKQFILNKEEKLFLKYAFKIIVHNSTMKRYLIKQGFEKQKLISIEIFDYLISNFDKNKFESRKIAKNQPIIIAGTLRYHKASYIYHLPSNVKFNLYGVGYDEKIQQSNVNYNGAFSPEELPYRLDGSYGLVWDGDSIYSCTGIYGKYLRINDPHKLSLYLVAGLPVIIWKGAAQADFVRKNGCGLIIDSLTNIQSIINSVSNENYLLMKRRAQKMGEKLHSGFFLKKLLNQLI
ncbi:hypothetical protein FC89_GL000859 [Liquorilactobacillus ghanensis DSM 18630]|uniref:Beta-1,6-galactofuranosyltransferase n=1 Tax=Liquorilactobacillus ghanensis DSM 18630 TaxID=1423750 RepID=A0A0R1VQ92_9LACO|nr:hypothetical protein [Liquorilactobacillus ghanensis]KRM05995.1 hypothetical protein FC89_GL000859 [Liquorilactobacillus ghanensis DSM 18630]